MNDDPYGNLLPSSSVLPLPLALLLFLLFFVLGALFAMCESAAETANESRIKKDAENRAPKSCSSISNAAQASFRPCNRA